MAHRLVFHNSKCKNLHGHRYKITANCQVKDSIVGQSKFQKLGMALDFGFLKSLLLKEIDEDCDHALTLNIEDVQVLEMLGIDAEGQSTIRAEIESKGFYATTKNLIDSKLYVITNEPTAENLAFHWFQRLEKPVLDASESLAFLLSVEVEETPTCRAIYKKVTDS